MSYLETTARTYVNKYNINISDKKEIKRLLFILNKIPCLYRKKRKMLINRLLYKSKIIKKYCIVKKCNKELLNLIKTNIRWSYHILKRKIKKPILFLYN